jgi:hypothetical protein
MGRPCVFLGRAAAETTAGAAEDGRGQEQGTGSGDRKSQGVGKSLSPQAREGEGHSMSTLPGFAHLLPGWGTLSTKASDHPQSCVCPSAAPLQLVPQGLL